MVVTECPRCHAGVRPHRLFCESCGKLLDRDGLRSARVSTEDSRSRALDEIDRLCGIL